MKNIIQKKEKKINEKRNKKNIMYNNLTPYNTRFTDTCMDSSDGWSWNMR